MAHETAAVGVQVYTRRSATEKHKGHELSAGQMASWGST